MYKFSYSLDTSLPIDGRKFTRTMLNTGIYLKEEKIIVCISPKDVSLTLVTISLRQGKATGYSIVNNELWKTLGLSPQNSRYASNQELQEKEDILLKLSAHHYINFQMAGSTWCIYQEKAS